jgi:hypothetical protein
VEIKVERGRPTPEELAAVVALVRARAAAAEAAERAAGQDDAPAGPPTGWAAPARRLPAALPRPSATAWRSSGRPGGCA